MPFTWVPHVSKISVQINSDAFFTMVDSVFSPKSILCLKALLGDWFLKKKYVICSLSLHLYTCISFPISLYLSLSLFLLSPLSLSYSRKTKLSMSVHTVKNLKYSNRCVRVLVAVRVQKRDKIPIKFVEEFGRIVKIIP